jgi:hypothetical protein
MNTNHVDPTLDQITRHQVDDALFICAVSEPILTAQSARACQFAVNEVLAARLDIATIARRLSLR